MAAAAHTVHAVSACVCCHAPPGPPTDSCTLPPAGEGPSQQHLAVSWSTSVPGSAASDTVFMCKHRPERRALLADPAVVCVDRQGTALSKAMATLYMCLCILPAAAVPSRLPSSQARHGW